MAGLPPLQDVVNYQEVNRVPMDARPGMYLKYLPIRYDAVTGQLLSGGAYLFDTHENAANYWDWTTNEFEVAEGVKFWSQKMFTAHNRFVWEVIGAVNFAPVDDHAVGRFQRWSYEGADAAAELRRLCPQLRDMAKEQGAAAFWLLHHPKEKQIAVQLAFPKKDGGADPRTVGNETVAYAQSQVDLGQFFVGFIKAKKENDRTSLFITLWLPRSRLAGGVAHSHPMFPTYPAVQKQ